MLKGTEEDVEAEREMRLRLGMLLLGAMGRQTKEKGITREGKPKMRKKRRRKKMNNAW